MVGYVRNLISFHHRREGGPSTYASRNSLPIDPSTGESGQSPHWTSGTSPVGTTRPRRRVHLPSDRLEDAMAGREDDKKRSNSQSTIVASLIEEQNLHNCRARKCPGKRTEEAGMEIVRLRAKSEKNT